VTSTDQGVVVGAVVPSCAGGVVVESVGMVLAGGVVVSGAGCSVGAGVLDGSSLVSPVLLHALSDRAPTAARAKTALRIVVFMKCGFLI